MADISDLEDDSFPPARGDPTTQALGTGIPDDFPNTRQMVNPLKTDSYTKVTNEDLKRLLQSISRDRKDQLDRIEEKLDTLLARIPPERFDEEEWVAAYERDE